MTATLIEFERFPPSDGSIWLQPDDIRRVEKSPHRNKAARIWFYSDGREEYADVRVDVASAAARINDARRGGAR